MSPPPPHTKATEKAPDCSTWKIEPSELNLGPQISEGSSGRVLMGRYKGQRVAVKEYFQEREGCHVAASERDREAAMLARSHHPNIVKFIGTCELASCSCIVMEYLSGGDLSQYIARQEGALHLQDSLLIALDIANGMNYLHQQGMVHRDLKPMNVIFSEDGVWKLADFGTARLSGKCTDMTAESGTYRWMAPEMVSSCSYTHKVDVYSFGLVLWELIAGEVPFREMSSTQVAFAVTIKHLRPKIPDRCPPNLASLIQSCWHKNPSRRPEFSNIITQLERIMVKVMMSKMPRRNLSSQKVSLGRQKHCKPLVQRFLSYTKLVVLSSRLAAI